MAEPFPEPADDAPFAVGGVVENLPWDSVHPARRAGHRGAAQVGGQDSVAGRLRVRAMARTSRRSGPSRHRRVPRHGRGGAPEGMPTRVRLGEVPRALRERRRRAVRPTGRRVRPGAGHRRAHRTTTGATATATAGAPVPSMDPIAFDATHFWSLVYGDRTPDLSRTVRRCRRRARRSESVTDDGGGVAGGAAPGRNCGRMQSHLDRPIGWTLSLSVGRAVTFNLGRAPTPGSMYHVVDQLGQRRARSGRRRRGRHAAIGGRGAVQGSRGVPRGGRVRGRRTGGVGRARDDSTAGKMGKDDGTDSESFEAPEGWASRLLAPSRATPPRDGWEPARLALLFRDEEDAR